MCWQDFLGNTLSNNQSHSCSRQFRKGLTIASWIVNFVWYSHLIGQERTTKLGSSVLLQCCYATCSKLQCLTKHGLST